MLFQHKIVGEKYEKEYMTKISVIKDVAVYSDCEPKGFTREFVTNEVLLDSRSFMSNHMFPYDELLVCFPAEPVFRQETGLAGTDSL